MVNSIKSISLKPEHLKILEEHPEISVSDFFQTQLMEKYGLNHVVQTKLNEIQANIQFLRSKGLIVFDLTIFTEQEAFNKYCIEQEENLKKIKQYDLEHEVPKSEKPEDAAAVIEASMKQEGEKT